MVSLKDPFNHPERANRFTVGVISPEQEKAASKKCGHLNWLRAQDLSFVHLSLKTQATRADHPRVCPYY